MSPDFSDSQALLKWVQGHDALKDFHEVELIQACESAASFKAFETGAKRPVLIKLFAASLSAEDWDDRAQEARFQMQLNHDHKEKLYRYGRAAPCSFLVREYIQGPSLLEWAEKKAEAWEGVEPTRELLTVFASLAEALIYCHKSGLIHGNIKASNVIIESRNQRPVLVDFLLSKGPVSEAQREDWTTYFPSPEQKRPDHFGPPTAKTDVWGLGSALLIAAGNCSEDLGSWTEKSPEQVRAAITEILSSEEGSAPSWFLELIDGAIQNQPSRRSSMNDFGETLFERSLGAPPNKWVLGLLTLAILIFVIYYLHG